MKMEDTIKIRQNNNCLILDIMSGNPCIEDFEYIFEAVEKCDLSKIILLNFKKVNEFDDTFINYFKCLSKKLVDIDIRIFGLSPILNSIFYLFKLDNNFQIYNNEQDAINKNNPLIRRRFRIV